jgi:hypothetical protein
VWSSPSTPAPTSPAASEHVVYQDGGCDPSRRPRYAIQRIFSGQKVFLAGDQVSGPFRTGNGSCKLLPASLRVHEVGAEVPPSDFVTGSEAVE